MREPRLINTSRGSYEIVLSNYYKAMLVAFYFIENNTHLTREGARGSTAVPLNVSKSREALQNEIELSDSLSDFITFNEKIETIPIYTCQHLSRQSMQRYASF